MQGTISKDLMKSAVKEVWIRSLTEIQPDILEMCIRDRNSLDCGAYQRGR